MQNISDFLFPSLKGNGKLTKEEFIIAGDYLVYMCPTWSWSSAAPGKCAKQFLVTRNVPSIDEDSMKDIDSSFLKEETNDFILVPFTSNFDKIIDDITDDTLGLADKDDDDIPDMDSFTSTFNSNILEDPMEWKPPLQISKNSNIMKTHTFDLYITYDKFFSTPHLWFNGFDSEGRVLPPSIILDSLLSSHINKTITIEIHHFLDIPMVSVHPCRHSNAMKHILNLGNGDSFRVDQYLIFFLRMMSFIIPNINYDHTMSL